MACPWACSSRHVAAAAWLVVGLGASRGASGGDLSVKPVIAAGVGYDSNVFDQASDVSDDYLGTLGVRVPVEYKMGSHATLTGSYLGVQEWYRQLTQLDTFPARQLASATYLYNSGRKLTVGLGGTYSESRRPEEVFPQSGVQFGRSLARSVGGNAFLDRKLTRRDDLELNYNYGRSLYLEDERADSHTGMATLGRQFSQSFRLDVRYLVEYYTFPVDGGNDTSQAATLGWSQKVSRTISLKLRAGGRFVAGTTKPELEASLTREWRQSTLTASYNRTRTFVPTSEHFADTDSAGLAFNHAGRALGFSASSDYYRSRSETQEYESFRGRVDTVYMLEHWLGLGVSYLYTHQRPMDSVGLATKRHLARVGFVVSPWGRTEPRGLP